MFRANNPMQQAWLASRGYNAVGNPCGCINAQEIMDNPGVMPMQTMSMGPRVVTPAMRMPMRRMAPRFAKRKGFFARLFGR